MESFNRFLTRNLSQIKEEIIIRIRHLIDFNQSFLESFNRFLTRNLSQIKEEIIIRIRDLIDFKVFLMFNRFRNLRFEHIR